MTPSPLPPSRPLKIIWDILTSYVYSTLKRKARDGLGFGLTCAQGIKNVLKDKDFVHNDHPDKFDPYALLANCSATIH